MPTSRKAETQAMSGDIMDPSGSLKPPEDSVAKQLGIVLAQTLRSAMTSAQRSLDSDPAGDIKVMVPFALRSILRLRLPAHKVKN